MGSAPLTRAELRRPRRAGAGATRLASLALLALVSASGPALAQGDSAVFGTAEPFASGFRGRVYRLPEGTSRLPDFDTLRSVGEVFTGTIDVAPRDFTEGFPGVPELVEWFAIEYRTTFRAERAGTYEFRLLSDDGSRLYIDTSLVVDNDGGHSPRSATGRADLSAGAHAMRVQYFQGPRVYIALQLYYRELGGEEVVFPGEAFTLSTPGPGGRTPWWRSPLWLVLLLAPLAYLFLRRRRRAAGRPPPIGPPWGAPGPR